MGDKWPLTNQFVWLPKYSKHEALEEKNNGVLGSEKVKHH